MMILKSLLSLCSIVVLLVPTLILPTRMRACPPAPPSTLLGLYRASDAIYVGRFDKVVDHEPVSESADEDGVVMKVRKHFDISSALMGETRKLLVLQDTDYRSKSREASPETKPEVEEDPAGEEVEIDTAGYRADELKPGELVMLFLKKGEDGETLELADYRDGIKHMTPERLDAYSARIKELNSIFSAKKPDDTAIVEWLVRCIQDPITRWEGAFELEQSYEMLDWEERAAVETEEETSKEPETGSEVEEQTASTEHESEAQEQVVAATESSATEETSEIEAEDSEYVGARYARLVSESQKQILLNTVLDTKVSDESVSPKRTPMSPGDQVLLNLVSRWGDNRLARLVLDRLQIFQSHPSVALDLMSIATGILDDDELPKILDKYSDSWHQGDDEIVGDTEEEDAPDKEESGETSEASDAEEAIQPESAPPTTEVAVEAKVKSGKVEAPKLTYRELRAELMAKFLEGASAALILAHSKNAEKERAAGR